MLHLAISLSLIFGFVLTEVLGVLTGGLISAGYLALYLHQPYRVLSTVGLSCLVCLGLYGLERVTILYGRRRFMAAVLLGIIGSWLFQKLPLLQIHFTEDVRLIGYMIPGLIANDMHKQGMGKTLLALGGVTGLIYLILKLGWLQ